MKLEKLEIVTGEQNLSLQSLVLFLLRTSPPPLLSLKLDVWLLRYIRPDAMHDMELPVALRKFSMTLHGTREQHRSIFNALDGLPSLEYLGLNLYDNQVDRQLLGFPKLLRCLRWASIYWPMHSEFLSAAPELEH